MSIRITCISKDNGNHSNPHEAIANLGWIEDTTNKEGNSTRIEMYDWIKDKGGVAHVKDARGNTAYVRTAASVNGTKYVRTQADGKWTDNLLALREC